MSLHTDTLAFRALVAWRGALA